MAYITRQELNGATWWTWISTEGYNTEILTTAHQVTEAEAEAWRAAYLTAHAYDAAPVFVAQIMNHREAIRSAIVYIKTENPNLTAWNNYLAAQAWDDALAVRWFFAVLARELAGRAEVTLADYTETQVLNALKTWIINTPAAKLEKVIFSIG